MGGHVVRQTRAYQVHEIPAVERSSTVPRRFIEQVVPRAPCYPGPVAVRGGHGTASMGEGLLIGMYAAANATTFASKIGDLLGALHNFAMTQSPARVDFAAESLFHVDGTARQDYVADVPLPTADRDAAGNAPRMAAVMRWLAAAAD